GGGGRPDLRVHLRMYLIGEEERDDLCVAYGLGGSADGQTCVFRCGARGAAFAEPDLHVHAGVVEVEGVRMTLAAVAEDRDLAGEEGEVAFAVDRCPLGVSFR